MLELGMCPPNPFVTKLETKLYIIDLRVKIDVTQQIKHKFLVLIFIGIILIQILMKLKLPLPNLIVTRLLPNVKKFNNLLRTLGPHKFLYLMELLSEQSQRCFKRGNFIRTPLLHYSWTSEWTGEYP